MNHENFNYLNEQLPVTEAFWRTVAFLRSTDFLNKLSGKNLPPEMLQKTLAMIYDPNFLEILSQRADWLLQEAQRALKNFYGKRGDILIPFSGGRDSSSLSALTAFLFPQREIYLATALNGFEHHPENAASHAQKLAELVGRPVTHLFADLSDGFDIFVVGSARNDRKMLGHPGICSACKLLIEDRLAQLALSLGVKYIPFGYVSWQGAQQWPEQTPTQIAVSRQFLQEKYPQLRMGQPLYSVYNLPFDSALVLGRLGLPPAEHKKEIGCEAKNLNPQQIEPDRLQAFVRAKLEEISANPSAFTMSDRVPPAGRFKEEIGQLRQDGDFMKGVFNS